MGTPQRRRRRFLALARLYGPRVDVGRGDRAACCQSMLTLPSAVAVVVGSTHGRRTWGAATGEDEKAVGGDGG